MSGTGVFAVEAAGMVGEPGSQVVGAVLTWGGDMVRAMDTMPAADTGTLRGGQPGADTVDNDITTVNTVLGVVDTSAAEALSARHIEPAFAAALALLTLAAGLFALKLVRQRRARVRQVPVPDTLAFPRSYRVQLPGGVLAIGNAQDRGARREQQDSFGCSDTTDLEGVARRGLVAVVADGMGGLELGREASQAAVRAFLRAFEASDPAEPASSTLRRALDAANLAVLELADEADARGAVGTTLVAACVRDGVLHWIGAGDSRLYLLRGGELRLLTVDHSYTRTLERRVAAGVLTVEQAAQHPDRHALVSFLGQDSPAEVSANPAPEPLRHGDRLLLCSDGVHGVLSAPRIAAALAAEAQPAAEALVAAVLAEKRPRQDNLTAIVLAYELDRS